MIVRPNPIIVTTVVVGVVALGVAGVNLFLFILFTTKFNIVSMLSFQYLSMLLCIYNINCSIPCYPLSSSRHLFVIICRGESSKVELNEAGKGRVVSSPPLPDLTRPLLIRTQGRSIALFYFL